MPQRNLHAKKEDRDIAAENFARMLLEGREVLCQDAAMLQDKYPNHPVYGHKLFSGRDWEEWKKHVHDLIKDATTRGYDPE